MMLENTEIRNHYTRCWPIIKSFFVDESNQSWRAAVPSHKGWWDVEGDTAKLYYPDDDTFFNKILPALQNSDNPALYWTTQFFTPETKNITKPYVMGKGIKEQIGGREDTAQISFIVDIDRAKGTDVHDPEVVKHLQEAVKFFATYFLERGVSSFGTAFSGGGCYAQFHPRLGLLPKEKNTEQHVWTVKLFQKAFDLLIGDIAAKFFEATPEAIKYVKFDALNYDAKRQIKTILSLHKTLPYAVIPFNDKRNPIIDFEHSKTPLSESVLQEAQNWLKYYDDLDSFGPIMEPYFKKAKTFLEQTTHVDTRHIKIEGEPIKPKEWAPCIKELIRRKNLKSGSGASRALALIAAYMRFTGFPPDRAFRIFTNKAKQWNAETSNIFESFYNTDTCFVPNCDKIKLKSAAGFPHLEMGELEICKQDRYCKDCLSPVGYHLGRRRNEGKPNKQEIATSEPIIDPSKFLTAKDLLVLINNSFDTRIVHDKKVRNVVFLTGISAYTKDPLNLFLEGPSSSGKTYVVVETMRYFPAEDVWFIGNMSPTALAHDYGNVEIVDGEPRKVIKLSNKILVFLERPNIKTLEMLKPILSHDRERIQYRITEKTKEGQNRTFKTEIEGWPSFIFCTTETTLLKEISTRNLLYAPEVSKEKVEDALKMQRNFACYPWKHNSKEENFINMVRNSIHFLKSQNNGNEVAIPDISALDCAVATTDTRIMRDNKKRLELIKACAWLHSQGRERLEVNDGENSSNYIVANFHDIFVGLALYDEVKLSTETGLAPVVIDFFWRVLKPLCDNQGTCSYPEMAQTHYQMYHQLIGDVTLRLHRVKPLVEAGYVLEDDDPVDRRKKVFSIVRDIEDPQTAVNSRQIYFRSLKAENELNKWFLEVKKICRLKNHVINQLSKDTVDIEIPRARNTLLDSYIFLGVSDNPKPKTASKNTVVFKKTTIDGNFQKTRNVCDRCGDDAQTSLYHSEHLCDDCLSLALESDKIEELEVPDFSDYPTAS